jgi:hypothetical protein
MNTLHRAMPEQWATIESTTGSFISSTILELRARVEALEAVATTRSFKIDTSKWSDEQRRQFLGNLSEPASVERFTDPRLGEPWMVKVDGIQHGPAMPPAPSPDATVQHGPIPRPIPRMVVEGTFEHGATAAPFPADSLVERVATAMQPGTFDWSAYEGEARAAIREVAAWLRTFPEIRTTPGGVATSLDDEVER